MKNNKTLKYHYTHKKKLNEKRNKPNSVCNENTRLQLLLIMFMGSSKEFFFVFVIKTTEETKFFH